MTAGKGIVHAEMPASFEEAAYGFQLWINLDAKNKFCQPQYQEFTADKLPVYQGDNFSAKVIAGKVFDVEGPIVARSPCYYIDFTMNKGSEYVHEIPVEWNSMIIVHSGSLYVQERKQDVVKAQGCVVFERNREESENLKFNILEDNTKFILLAGQPLDEPSVQYGPFVLNTRD